MRAVDSREKSEVWDASFLEVRAKLLEIAATLDRVGRAGGADDADKRAFVAAALGILADNAPDKAQRLQILYSKS